MLRATPGLREINPAFSSCQHHLMDGRRRDAEEAHHVRLRRRASVHQGIGVDERQILPLLLA